MKGLFSQAIASTLVAATLITVAGNDAQAQVRGNGGNNNRGGGGFDINTDCTTGSVSHDIFSYAACSTNAGNDTGNKGTLLEKL
ncbi:MAG: PEP-CTERM sorting domain-containing protein, partial [Spirulina sp. SIO3F2]|nr:PEP-CTERM sorting domain-containing protein [Spirulina sp. SIO3F2]